jgi:hypothetical protein
MKTSVVLGRMTAGIVGAACWSYAAHRWDITYFYLFAVLAIIAPWLKPVPPLPKIGDYEDD